jgi:hypothetical protein
MVFTDFNIIIGERCSNKTNFLIDLSKIYNNSCFISIVDELPRRRIKHISFYNHFLNKDDSLKYFTSLKERIEKNNYEYLFIDDFNYLPKTSEVYNIINDIKIKKFFTSNSKIDNNPFPMDFIKQVYLGKGIDGKTLLCWDENDPNIFIDINDFLIQIKRNEKIKKILKND